MSFSIIQDFQGKQDLTSYINSYKSINNVQAPSTVSSNFNVLNYGSNCFFCMSETSKINIVLPSAKTNKGVFYYFVNITDNELISVSDLATLTEVQNISNYNSLSSSILNSFSGYFSILFSDGNYWYRIN